jgi:GTP-binding protein
VKKHKLVFLKSAVFPKDYPEPLRFEIVVAGRSNAGKSSFINALAGGEKVAKVSQMPGKTTLLNFFDVDDKYRIVDTPGYGFSKRGGDEQSSWQQMMENYFSLRGNLRGVLLLMDYKRDWEEDEAIFLSYASRIGVPILVILTKADRGKPREIQAAINRIKTQSGIKSVMAIAAEKKLGVDEIEEFYFSQWVRPALQQGGP